MFDAEAIHTQIPSNIESNYQQAETTPRLPWPLEANAAEEEDSADSVKEVTQAVECRPVSLTLKRTGDKN